MKNTIYLFVTAVSLLIIGGFNPLYGQNTATIQVTAHMLDPITITSSTGLDFGTELLPGISRSISTGDGGAAKFYVDGETGNDVRATFILPEFLVHEGGEDEMPITFGSGDAAYNHNDTPSGSITFDPNTGDEVFFMGGSDHYFWLGGTINPRGDQVAGNYSGDVTIELNYIEN